METHFAYQKATNGKNLFLTKDKKVVDILTEECIMHYVTLSRLIGPEGLSPWKVVALKDLVLDNKDIITQLLK